MSDKKIYDENSYLKIEEVCEIMGLHLNTVYRMIKNGDIPSRKVANRWRVKYSDILNILEHGTSKNKEHENE